MSERAKLVEELRRHAAIFFAVAKKRIDGGDGEGAIDAAELSIYLQKAAAQIEADGKEIERLRALVAAQDERDAYRRKQDAIEAREPKPLHTGQQ